MQTHMHPAYVHENVCMRMHSCTHAHTLTHAHAHAHGKYKDPPGWGALVKHQFFLSCAPSSGLEKTSTDRPILACLPSSTIRAARVGIRLARVYLDGIQANTAVKSVFHRMGLQPKFFLFGGQAVPNTA